MYVVCTIKFRFIFDKNVYCTDDVEQKAKIARRKVEMQITDENAKTAKKEQIEKKVTL